MKIFGIGIQKTGTSTLGWCFQHLGYKHRSYDRRAAWYLRRDQPDRLRRITDAFDTFEDEPWGHCYALADQWYPDAKFILTVRKDPERWYNSLVNHCDRVPFNEHRRHFLGYVMPRGHKEELIAHYQAHIAEVTAYFKDRPDKLLTLCWENGDGWEKLCGFLNKPVPGVAIPRTNAQPDGKVYPPLTVWRVAASLPGYYLNKIRTDIGLWRRGTLY